MVKPPKAGVFQFRRKKDEKGIAEARAEGGKYKTKSNKASDPRDSSGSKSLPKGSSVTFRKKTPVSHTSTITRKTETSVTPKSKTEFRPADYNEKEAGVGKRGAQIRKTTSEFTPQFKENPDKVKARVQAQSEGKTTYHFKGKHELSGKNVKVPDGSSATYKHTATPGIKIKPGTPEHVTVRKPINQEFGKAPKRKLPRVDYLKGKSGKHYGSEGRRKKTEAGYGR